MFPKTLTSGNCYRDNLSFKTTMNPASIHTTNYRNTFIEVASDCPATAGEIPPSGRAVPSVAYMQYDLISRNPYQFTSDDVLFQVFVEKNEIRPAEREAARTRFFSRGQACLRSSPLTKRYGWGIHSNSDGKIALYGLETLEYRKFTDDPDIVKVKAMKNRK